MLVFFRIKIVLKSELTLVVATLGKYPTTVTLSELVLVVMVFGAVEFAYANGTVVHVLGAFSHKTKFATPDAAECAYATIPIKSPV